MKKNGILTKSSIITIALIMSGLGVTSAFAFNSNSLTTTQRNIIKQAHELKSNGNYGRARALMEDLRDEIKADRYAIKETIKKAIANNDYNAFQDVASSTHFGNNVTEEVFAKIVEAHNLREAGDVEGAKEIISGLGFKKFGYERKGRWVR